MVVTVRHKNNRPNFQVSEEMKEVMVQRAEELFRERTPKEMAEGEERLNRDFYAYMKRQKMRRTSRRASLLVRPQRFFGIKIGWWY